jgi:hypothetical protein
MSERRGAGMCGDAQTVGSRHSPQFTTLRRWNLGNIGSGEWPEIAAEALTRMSISGRARTLGRMVASVGPLALAVIGGGVFATCVTYVDRTTVIVSLAAAARASFGQIRDLARYVQQADPQLFGQVLEVLSLSGGRRTLAA